MTILEKLDLIKKMTAVFEKAASEREDREQLVIDPCPPWPGRAELEWVIYERSQMLAAVNSERLARGLPVVAEVAIKRAEQMAQGHSDYSSKFALYCTELVIP
jgi:hypothetical protein